MTGWQATTNHLKVGPVTLRSTEPPLSVKLLFQGDKDLAQALGDYKLLDSH